jgi:hypothetical protein
LGFVYILSFWSMASQISALSGPGGLQPATALYETLLQEVGTHAPWVFPGLGWVSQSDLWMLAICGLGVLGGLGLLYGCLPWGSGLLSWVSWVSLIQMCQPWLSTHGDLLLAEVGLYALFLVPVRAVFYPALAAMGSRLTGILLLNGLLVRVMFTAGMSKLTGEAGLWEDGTALYHFFETQPLPAMGGWFLHQLPGTFLVYLLWGWMFIELMLPWYVVLPRIFRNICAGALVLRSLVLLMTGHHGITPLLCVLLAASLVDDVSWRRLLPLSWGPAASTRLYRPGWPGLACLMLILPLFLFQSIGGGPEDVPPPWSWVQQGLARVVAGGTPPPDPKVITRRLELSLQGSLDGQNWVEYPFWLKPTHPASLPASGFSHTPRLDAGFEALVRSPLLEQGCIPLWLLRLQQGLLRGDPRLESLFPANPFPDRPPRFLRLVLYEMSFADPVTKRENEVWWERRPLQRVGPVFRRVE